MLISKEERETFLVDKMNWSLVGGSSDGGIFQLKNGGKAVMDDCRVVIYMGRISADVSVDYRNYNIEHMLETRDDNLSEYLIQCHNAVNKEIDVVSKNVGITAACDEQSYLEQLELLEDQKDKIEIMYADRTGNDIMER